MARRKAQDVAIQEIRQVRQKFSRRLAKAMREGRFLEELRSIGREGRRVLHPADSNGRSHGLK